jgi:hypothetical protein
MTSTTQSLNFFPALLTAYCVGTPVASLILHIAISLIAPGDGGTLVALGSAAIFVILLIAIGALALVVLPILAVISWPFRILVTSHPILACMAAVVVGSSIGGVLTATEFQIGPDDYWSGPLVGLVFALVWFEVVRRRALRAQTEIRGSYA